ncbi:hypothetical protein [Brevibacterium album]|nr:hypothetical protein [Brevibacterium album]
MSSAPAWELTEAERREAEERQRRIARELEEERKRRDSARVIRFSARKG